MQYVYPSMRSGNWSAEDLRDDFPGPALDAARWVDHYLPQWTTPERSAARYDFTDGGLQLRIDADQPAWRDEDGPFRVSNIQTGTFSGPVGSDVGTHRHTDGLTVRTEVATSALWTPSGGGYAEATVRATDDPTCMLGIWLVGFEQSGPDDSGEICIAELFGSAIGRDRSTVRLGVKAHHDPRLRTEVTDLELPIDATGAHTYGAGWTADWIEFVIDGRVARRVTQGIRYPLQLMIDLFEFPTGDARPADAYPKTALVQSARGYRRR
ncbi:glycoside hydrolase family 16 protein [Herbiconiux daphne]|uniref:Glycoside hydrolase family 16 protein n=1 Tax=Herbiconiux daphne TaxID=2970914 RepID=A0ABT2H1A2_9MICO|nr:glycoside hydrolase family 16 protein [Herbiconiux daphne]MCS5733711.1 glycoside hydrolase family 16 protein [Herbiconiux daphne]